jgi:2-phosphosulfolactate phosphatase
VVTAIRDAHRQLGHTIRLDWGTTGAAAIAPGYDVADVVDVLSFTTSVSVATDRGATVYPYRWRDETAELFAAAHAAALAGRPLRSRESDISLPPASIRSAPCLRRIVLPSPNESTISTRLAANGVGVIAVSLRNRGAVASGSFTSARSIRSCGLP